MKPLSTYFIIVICVCKLVITQTLSSLQRPPQFRLCEQYQAIPINETTSPTTCLRELASASNVHDPDAEKSIIQISVENGYTIQSYNVTTSDGYILTIFRISGGRRSPPREGKPAVLVLHGWGNSCDSWIALPNDKNLAYLLADTGYDVWLGCHRGTSFSLGHTILNSNTDIGFWDFSFHEMGLYDFPAMVDHVLLTSGNEKIFVIAHSQGAIAFLVAASEIPSLNKKIRAAYLMAPGAYLGSSYEPFTSALLPILGIPIVGRLHNLLGGRFSLRDTSILTSALGIGRLAICQPKAIRCGVSDVYALAPYYFNRAQTNYTNLPRMIAKLLDTVTFRSLIHFAQNARSCTFRQYDFGIIENLSRYRAAEPPGYNLTRELRKSVTDAYLSSLVSQIQTPMYMFWGEQDAMVTPPDIQRLANELPPAALRAVIRVNDDTFEHMDFLVARDARVLVYEPLLAMMKEFADT